MTVQQLKVLYFIMCSLFVFVKDYAISGSGINFFLRDPTGDYLMLVARWKGLVAKSKCYYFLFFFPRQDRGFASYFASN